MISVTRVVAAVKDGAEAELVAGMVSMFLDLAAAVDPSNPANKAAEDEAADKDGDRYSEGVQARYAERNRCLYMALGWAANGGYPCGFKVDPEDPGWPVMYIDLPGGQVSWHMPAYDGRYDLHTTRTKYERIAQFSADCQEALSAEMHAGPFPADRNAFPDVEPTH